MNVMRPCEWKERRCFSPSSVTFAFTTSSVPSSSMKAHPTLLAPTHYCADHVPRVDMPYQRCEYMSNRTRLRCQSVRLAKDLSGNGFCEKHPGYIERIRKAGARARRVFDPGFDKDNVTLKPVELSDAEFDETLLTAESADGDSWPFVSESLYCTARLLDDAGNPLRNAEVFTQKESLMQYQRKLEEQKAQVNELRQLYSEKLQRLYSQSHLTNTTQPSAKATEKGKKGGEKKQKQVWMAAAKNVDQRMLREHRANRRYGSYARWQKTAQLLARAQAKLRGLPLPIPPTRLPANGCQHRDRIVRGRAKLPLEYTRHRSPSRAVGAPPSSIENGSSVEEQCSALLNSMLDHVESSLNAVKGQPGWVEVVETRVCRKPRVPLSDYCSAHILADAKQALFNKCSECSEPALPLTSWNRCKLHGVSLYLPLSSVATAAAHHHHAGTSTSSQSAPTMLIPSSSGSYRRAAAVGSQPPLYYPHQPSPLSMHNETNQSFHRRTTALHQSGTSYVFLPQSQQGTQQLTSATRPDGTHYYVMAPPPPPLTAPTAPSAGAGASRVGANYGWVSEVNRREPIGQQAPPDDFAPRQDSEILLLPKETNSAAAHKRMSVDDDLESCSYIRECKEQVKRETESKNRISDTHTMPLYLHGMDAHRSQPPINIVEVQTGMIDSQLASTSVIGGHLVRVNGSGRGAQQATAASGEGLKDADSCARCRPFDRSHMVKKGAAVAKRNQSHHHQFISSGYHNSPYGYPATISANSQRAPPPPIVYHQSQLASTPLKRQYSQMAGIGQVASSSGAAVSGYSHLQPATKIARMGSTGPVVRAPFQAIGSAGSRLVPSGGGGARGAQLQQQQRPLPSPRVIYNGGLGSVIRAQPPQQTTTATTTTTYYTASGNRVSDCEQAVILKMQMEGDVQIFRSPYRPSMTTNNSSNAATSQNAHRAGPSVMKPMAVVALPSGYSYPTTSPLYNHMATPPHRMVRSPSHGPPPTLSPAVNISTRTATNSELKKIEETGSALKSLLANNSTKEGERNGGDEMVGGGDERNFQKLRSGEATEMR